MADQEEVTTQEQELAEYLQERIKPGLNRGSIPLLARSIAKDIVQREHLNEASDDDEPDDEFDEEPEDEADDQEPEDEADDEEPQDEEPEDGPAAEADDETDDERDEEPEDEPEDEADDEPEDEADDEPEDEADDEPEDKADDESESPVDEFEAEMHELQAELGDEWIVRFSVQGEEAWLTAEKQDGSQHVEGPTAEVLLEAVELLDEGGGRSG